jgi:hypothetical protein
MHASAEVLARIAQTIGMIDPHAVDVAIADHG